MPASGRGLRLTMGNVHRLMGRRIDVTGNGRICREIWAKRRPRIARASGSGNWDPTCAGVWYNFSGFRCTQPGLSLLRRPPDRRLLRGGRDRNRELRAVMSEGTAQTVRQQDHARLLRHVDLFADLDRVTLAKLAARLQPLSYAARSIVFRQGESARGRSHRRRPC